ncbi:hypothetical protein KSF73_13280 [Burkholderiaceae bacterium DAT-1]|nr:hypothetical protein [Burkholderiaceae bacterium DAT-1]
MVSLIRSGDEGRVKVVQGTPYASDLNPRDQIMDQWGMEQASPRRDMAAPNVAPLSAREQVALAARLAPDVQTVLRGGLEPVPEDRRDSVPGIKARMHLEPERLPYANGLPPLHKTRR